MFPTSEQMTGFRRTLERDGIRSALLGARPDLLESVMVNDAGPLLTIPVGGGAHLVITVVKDDCGVTAWAVVVPDRADPTIHARLSPSECSVVALRELATLVPSPVSDELPPVTDSPRLAQREL